jgi:hypothetical protein
MERTGPLSVVRVTLVRIDPRQVTFQLERVSRNYGMTAAWTIDSIPEDAVVALNTGQFIGGIPWGWVVRDGVEAKPPGAGRLAMAFVVDSLGSPMLVTPDELPNVRARAWLAFQSYPALLAVGVAGAGSRGRCGASRLSAGVGRNGRRIGPDRPHEVRRGRAICGDAAIRTDRS